MDIRASDTRQDRILRLSDLLGRTGLSRATIYSSIGEDGFPHQISLGGRAVRWISGEVENWIKERMLATQEVLSQPSPYP